MAHTPGPWTTDIFGTAICVRTDTAPIAHIFRLEDQTSANGCLIAAAPDLLAALKAVESFLSDKRIGTVTYMEGADFYMDCDEHRRRVVAAIAKAEGT